MGFIQSLTDRLRQGNNRRDNNSYLKGVLGGSFYRLSDIKKSGDLKDIQELITTMRALANDSQISTALSYYATDSTIPNSSGDIIWASPIDDSKLSEDTADLVNVHFKRWNINRYARDHILELATIGNLYLPTTEIKRITSTERISYTHTYVGLDQHDIFEDDYDIISAYKIQPENIVHLWHDYQPFGYIYSDENDKVNSNNYIILPETSVIHFSLGGILGNYSIDLTNSEGEEESYDIEFSEPLLVSALQPTQTLNLLEDSVLLSSMIKIIRFISVDCGTAEEDEQMSTLMSIKNMIEQQMSLNTSSGDAQSYLNPQSPNNLIYVPKVNGTEPISITDLDMRDSEDSDDELLKYFQDKKLSVLGIPKEYFNFSDAEGLGAAGTVLSQRSNLYANILQRIETAYIEGWKRAINNYFTSKNMTQCVNNYELHMNPILTNMSSLQFDKRDSALSQASSLVALMKDLSISDDNDVKNALQEILLEAFPKTTSDISDWKVDMLNKDEEY